MSLMEAAPRSSLSPASGRSTGYHYRDALRLLFILLEGSEKDTATHERIFHGEKRALAMDFYIRYPDYLADALLDRYEASRDARILEIVRSIFDREEPDVRIVKMVRWKRGAYENLETALSILVARGLVRTTVKPFKGGKKIYEFVLSASSQDFLAQACMSQPALTWYRDRARLVIEVVGFKSGSAIKEDQYAHREYFEAPHGSFIPSIKERVMTRLRDLTGR